MKKPLPIWAIVASVTAVLAVVVVLFSVGGGGDASKEELTNIRANQQKMGGGSPMESPLAPKGDSQGNGDRGNSAMNSPLAPR